MHEKLRDEFIVDKLVELLEDVVGEINSRLDVLESETGLEIVKDMDPERAYPKGTLANVGGAGLKLWTGSQWRTVMNGVESVKVDGDTLIVERSDGTIEKSVIKNAARAKPVKVRA